MDFYSIQWINYDEVWPCWGHDALKHLEYCYSVHWWRCRRKIGCSIRCQWGGYSPSGDQGWRWKRWSIAGRERRHWALLCCLWDAMLRSSRFLGDRQLQGPRGQPAQTPVVGCAWTPSRQRQSPWRLIYRWKWLRRLNFNKYYKRGQQGGAKAHV